MRSQGCSLAVVGGVGSGREAALDFWWIFCWDQCNLSEQSRASRWLMGERKCREWRCCLWGWWCVCVCAHAQRAARWGANCRILGSLKRLSEVNSPGHNALLREGYLALWVVVCNCLIFLASPKSQSYPFKLSSIPRLASCSHIAAKLEIITDSVSLFLPV